MFCFFLQFYRNLVSQTKALNDRNGSLGTLNGESNIVDAQEMLTHCFIIVNYLLLTLAIDDVVRFIGQVY